MRFCFELQRFALCLFFFFNDTATTEIYTLSLHDALPICSAVEPSIGANWKTGVTNFKSDLEALFVTFGSKDRKSTRLNSSHSQISYAVFCLKKKNNN